MHLLSVCKRFMQKYCSICHSCAREGFNNAVPVGPTQITQIMHEHYKQFESNKLKRSVDDDARVDRVHHVQEAIKCLSVQRCRT